MALEIERKFMVHNLHMAMAMASSCEQIVQGYLVNTKDNVVRVRKQGSGDLAEFFLTVKNRVDDLVRNEYEFRISPEKGETMLAECPFIISKMRAHVPYGDLTIEVDIFRGENYGLVVAEVEFPKEEYLFNPPNWLGLEVTNDPRYINSVLAETPYHTWK